MGTLNGDKYRMESGERVDNSTTGEHRHNRDDCAGSGLQRGDNVPLHSGPLQRCGQSPFRPENEHSRGVCGADCDHATECGHDGQHGRDDDGPNTRHRVRRGNRQPSESRARLYDLSGGYSPRWGDFCGPRQPRTQEVNDRPDVLHNDGCARCQ